MKTFYPLREVSTGGGNFGFVVSLLTSTEVWNLKRKLKFLLEHPHGVVYQFDQFLDPQIYTWVELMSILGILFSGKEGCHGHMGKRAPTYQAPRFSLQTWNFLLRTLNGITIALLTEGRWRIWEI
jgi:hypothetical protein